LRLRKLDAFRFLAERKCPRVSGTGARRAAIRRDGETSKLFRPDPTIL
jgi:hypothetical protein